VNAQVSLSLRMGAHAGTYSTYVADTSDRALILAMPIVAGSFVPIVPGAPVKVEYSDSGGTYRLSSHVTRVARVPSPIVAVDRRGRVEHEQRRQDVRMELSVPVRFGVTMPIGVYADTDLPIFSGRTRDMSGGGVQLVTRQAMQPGTMLEMEIQLPKDMVRLAGEVVRLVATIDHGTHKDYVLGVRFIGAQKDRDKVIAHIFEQQRLRLKRGVRVD
jgi:c-di-GMP-binding flagellar brake protein YcgR